MGKLLEHARREMELAGLFEKGADYDGLIPESVLALVEAIEGKGHSGGSHQMTLEIFNRVANFKALSPITSKPEEWMCIADAGSPHEPTGLWQNLRQSSVFSRDGMKTWHDIDAPVKP